MEDKEKEMEAEKLCKEAESYISHLKRGYYPSLYMSQYANQQTKWVKENVDKAEKMVTRALILNHKSAEAFRLRGFINYIKSYDKYILNSYERAYEINPEDWKLLHNLALFYYNVFKNRDLDKATEFIIKAVEKQSTYKNLWITLSEILLKKAEEEPDFLQTALKYHLKFLELFPLNILAQRKTGEIYYKLNNFVEVINHYKIFTERNPKDFHELKLLGNAYREVGDIDNAIITYEKYMKNDPNSEEIKKFLFELYSLQGYNLTNEDEVIDFIKNKEVKERKAKRFCNTGFTRNRQGNAEGAIEVLKEALELDPKSTDARVYLGISNVILGNLEKGFQMINEIIEQHPDNSNAFISLGQAFKIKGDINKSIESYEKGIALMPAQNYKYYDHKVELAFLYRANNNTQKAIELFEDLIKDSPDKPRFLNLYGTFNISQKNPQKALELFIRALKLNQYLSETYINISLIHADLSNFDAALAYLKVALKIRPDNAQIHDVIKKVNEKRG